MQLFDDATLYFSDEENPNIPLVIPAMDHIDSELSASALNESYSPAIRAAASLGKKTLNRYYDKSDETEIYRIAMGKSGSG